MHRDRQAARPHVAPLSWRMLWLVGSPGTVLRAATGAVASLPARLPRPADEVQPNNVRVHLLACLLLRLSAWQPRPGPGLPQLGYPRLVVLLDFDQEVLTICCQEQPVGFVSW